MTSTHYTGDNQFAACGMCAQFATTSTTDRTAITCKRCLASLAKRDREFQRKARAWFASPDSPRRLGFGRRGHTVFGQPEDAARAIAREEGRL